MTFDDREIRVWQARQDRARAEYAHHPTVTGHHDGFLPTCPHCQRIKEDR